MPNYGEYFKKLRQAKGFTLRQVEKETDISNAYLSQLEGGKVKQPSPINLYKLAGLYGVKYEVLMSKVGYPVPKSEDTKNDLSKSNLVMNRFGDVTEDEELELLDYLKFMRSRKK